MQGKPDDVAINGRGAADIVEPQVDARIDAEVQEMLDETPRKRSRTARDVKMEGIFGTKARLRLNKASIWQMKECEQKPEPPLRATGRHRFKPFRHTHLGQFAPLGGEQTEA
ncbi:external alternative NAD(P)H-ubiquinone oxidoreductase B2, mitochondrial [Artemisia annua]|uniref:External alternative NAD(P)H-ubiquinone oxidoreductase B2, mitochondrial n=1 Tax=Artemisia annua TaxID=35608 RepID=A0A2U1LQC9_ARTAN|nr:external alternative NAD(P)H-ubiquinone oxidoreductase B2, mitochondrial [Artemisia annua]